MMENVSEKVFGTKLNMDFGMIQMIYSDPEAAIRYIEDYDSNTQ